MKKIIFVFAFLFSIPVFARDVTFKDVPDYVSDEKLQKWVAVNIEREARNLVESDSSVVAAKNAVSAATNQDLETFKESNNVEDPQSSRIPT